ncbi:hypothetical protein [Litchfieldella rifensis]|uniref:Uncharacterized protein n=1 Tax=Litchfieldella rifensis TaxID=762643 RepID=A0ABV7LT12_9GAMM
MNRPTSGNDDQAAGLRSWAARQDIAVEETPDRRVAPRLRTLMVVGLPDSSRQQRQRVEQVLHDWHAGGQRWIGDPGAWRVVALDAASPHLTVLADQQPRWALWVDSDLEGFRRAYLALKSLRSRQGPRRLLAIHPGFASRSGLLNNLQQAAADFLGIELLVLDGSTSGRVGRRA